jgi:hypothetical protein
MPDSAFASIRFIRSMFLRIFMIDPSSVSEEIPMCWLGYFAVDWATNEKGLSKRAVTSGIWRNCAVAWMGLWSGQAPAIQSYRPLAFKHIVCDWSNFGHPPLEDGRSFLLELDQHRCIPNSWNTYLPISWKLFRLHWLHWGISLLVLSLNPITGWLECKYEGLQQSNS